MTVQATSRTADGWRWQGRDAHNLRITDVVWQTFALVEAWIALCSLAAWCVQTAVDALVAHTNLILEALLSIVASSVLRETSTTSPRIAFEAIETLAHRHILAVHNASSIQTTENVGTR